jgi:hypothetical protein
LLLSSGTVILLLGRSGFSGTLSKNSITFRNSLSK